MSFLPEIPLSLDKDILLSANQQPELLKLIEACIANDRSAQETLYKRYYGKMMGLCMRYVKNRDDAMSILNQGFLKVFQNLDKYAFNGSFDGWIYRIVYNSIIDQLRSRNRDFKTSEIDYNALEVSIEANSIQNLYIEDLLKLLDELPESSRVVFNMFAIEGFKHEEIAEQLNISTGTSKWHVNAARTLLKEMIAKRFKS